MCLQTAGRGAQRMFYVKHFVIQNELHGIGGNFWTVQPAVHHNLVERRIISSRTASSMDARSIPAADVAAALRNIRSSAKRTWDPDCAPSPTVVLDAPCALAAHPRDVPAGRVRQGKFPVEIAQFTRHAAAIHLRQAKWPRRLRSPALAHPAKYRTAAHGPCPRRKRIVCARLAYGYNST